MGFVVFMLLLFFEKKIFFKFDVFVKEFNWNFEMIYYVLYWNIWNMEFQWNGSKCRFVLEILDYGFGVIVVEVDVQFEEFVRLVFEDCSYFLFQFKEGLILILKNFFFYFVCLFFSYNFVVDWLRDLFVEVLKKWLWFEVLVLLNEFSLVLECFWINYGDLKF